MAKKNKNSFSVKKKNTENKAKTEVFVKMSKVRHGGIEWVLNSDSMSPESKLSILGSMFGDVAVMVCNLMDCVSDEKVAQILKGNLFLPVIPSENCYLGGYYEEEGQF